MEYVNWFWVGLVVAIVFVVGVAIQIYEWYEARRIAREWWDEAESDFD